MTYVPDPLKYQQIALGGITGPYDCTAWGAAFRVDAHSKGTIRTTGRQVRLHSDEPVPDRASPGLNLGQVDAAVIEVTSGRVNLDTFAQSRALDRADVEWRIRDGRFCGLSVNRGVLVRRGFVSGFSGAHDITVFTRDSEPDQLLMFDPLVRNIVRISWDVAMDAAEALTGKPYAQFTRDLTPDYRVVILPDKGEKRKAYYRHRLDSRGRIVGGKLGTTGGMRKRCTVPSYHASLKAGITGRYLVQITEGEHAGEWVNARFAEELNP